MSDTIDLLEKIGCDSTMRRASAAELAATLQSDATSKQLLAAITSRDAGVILAELGHARNHVMRATQGPAYEHL